jgi:hypothetical protein
MAAKVRILLLSICFFYLKTEPANAGEIVITGTYQGKNLYIQNPFTGNLQDFCTLEVFVNNKKASTNLNASAYEIDLSFLQLDDEVLIKIVHKDDCKPKVLNPTVIKSTSNFHFVQLTIDEDHISWTTSHEKQAGKFYLEQFWHNAWVILSEIDSKGGLGTNAYQTTAKHHSGLNKYRIRFKDVNGHFFYSKTTEFTSSKPPITFTPEKVSNTIILSHHAYYEILDKNGVSLLKGSGMYISVSSLKPGDYYLNVDNRTEKFSKH